MCAVQGGVMLEPLLSILHPLGPPLTHSSHISPPSPRPPPSQALEVSVSSSNAYMLLYRQAGYQEAPAPSQLDTAHPASWALYTQPAGHCIRTISHAVTY